MQALSSRKLVASLVLAMARRWMMLAGIMSSMTRSAVADRRLRAHRPMSAVATRLIATLSLVGCGQTPLEENGLPSHTLSIKAGRALELTLQTIGPGEYASPPLVSSTAVRFVDVRRVTPAVPAGPTQRFRFEAVERGVAVIVFHHTGQGPTVEDTINVH